MDNEKMEAARADTIEWAAYVDKDIPAIAGQCFDRGYSAANEWVRIDERMPDVGEWYLVAVNQPNGGIQGLTEIDFFDGTWNRDAVIAWMPLPAPYQSKGEGEGE